MIVDLLLCCMCIRIELQALTFTHEKSFMNNYQILLLFKRWTQLRSHLEVIQKERRRGAYVRVKKKCVQQFLLFNDTKGKNTIIRIFTFVYYPLPIYHCHRLQYVSYLCKFHSTRYLWAGRLFLFAIAYITGMQVCS